jgi:DNA-binding response OmpR family regulator
LQPHILIATHKENDLLELLLGTENYALILKDSAEATLAYLREHTPALMMLDAHLPDLSGLVIAGRVRRVKRLQNVPIIALVSAKDTYVLKDAQHAGVNHIITKPLTGQDIRAIVAKQLGKTTLSERDPQLKAAS